MSESLEEKQQFLNQEIIQQNYDANEFSAFISGIRGEETVDLENWSLEDLKAVVEQFKAQYAQNQENQEYQENQENQAQQPEQDISNETQPQKESEKMHHEPENKFEKKVSNSDFPNEFLEPFYLVKKTEKMEANEITDRYDLTVTISNPQKIKQSLLSIPYFQYDMETKPVGYKVVRKVSDFTFLYETLPLFNGGVYNPVLPHFEFGLKDDSPKKMLYIQNYMNSLVENKFFRTLQIVYEFLTVPQSDWNQKRIGYSKMKTLPISKMPTLEGELIININKEEDSKALKIKDEINKKTEAFDLFNTTMDEILACIDKLIASFKTLSKSLSDLERAYQSNDILNAYFNRLKSLSSVWSEDYSKEKEILKDDFKYFFKYLNKENVSYLKKFEEFRVTRDDYKNKYEKVKKNQVRQQKDLELVKTLRIDYGLQLLMINEEYKNLIDRQAFRCKTQFMKYNQNQHIILQDYENCKNLFSINQEQQENMEGAEGTEEANNQE